MQGAPRGTIQARLAVVRIGLMAVTAVFITILVVGALVIYNAVNFASKEVSNAGYSFSDYMGDVGPLIGLASVITIIVAVAVYFGFRAYITRSEG